MNCYEYLLIVLILVDMYMIKAISYLYGVFLGKPCDSFFGQLGQRFLVKTISNSNCYSCANLSLQIYDSC